jgi:hypothetical protein
MCVEYTWEHVCPVEIQLANSSYLEEIFWLYLAGWSIPLSLIVSTKRMNTGTEIIKPAFFTQKNLRFIFAFLVKNTLITGTFL